MEVYIGIPQAVVLVFLIGLLFACVAREIKGGGGENDRAIFMGAAIILLFSLTLLWWGGFFTFVPDCTINVPC